MILASGLLPPSLMTRSQCNPAQLTIRPVSNSPCDVFTTDLLPDLLIAVTLARRARFSGSRFCGFAATDPLAVQKMRARRQWGFMGGRNLFVGRQQQSDFAANERTHALIKR